MAKTLNTTELIDIVAKKTKLSKAAVKNAVTTIFSEVKASVKKGTPVQISEFGTYKVVKRKARNGVNPSNQQKIKIPARKVVKFTAGKSFKSAVK